MTGRAWRNLLLALLLGGMTLGSAQGARITDKLLAGFYAEPDSSTQPIKVLPSDTPLERLEKKGPFTRVRLGDGSEGWVESRFITDEKPARIMLLELQAKNSQLQQQLREAERQLKALDKGAPAGDDNAELSRLKQQLADMQAENAQLKSSQANNSESTVDSSELRQRIAELEQQLTTASAGAGDNPELERLLQANQALEQRLAEIARLAGSSPSATTASPDRLEAWQLPLLLLAMLFSFIGGVVFKNYRLARRYGGLRV